MNLNQKLILSMTKKERHNLEDSVMKIRNMIYDIQGDINCEDWVFPYCRKMIREIDKLLYVLKQ
jgi:hypothetical protein